MPKAARRRSDRAVKLIDSFRFPRCAHLRAAAEFQAVFGEGKRMSGVCFRLHARISGGATEARLGVAVSRRVDKTSVGRNRIRRQAKELFRVQRASLPACDFVLIAKPEAAQADNTALRVDLLSLLDRARTLKSMPTTGTMPPAVAAAGRGSINP